MCTASNFIVEGRMRPQVVDRWFILCAYYMFEHWNCN